MSTLEVFCHDAEEIELAKKYGALAGKLHTALHEVVGHASGQLEPGVAGPDATLKNYASTLEEGRADLVALYYLMDPKLVELGVMPSLEVGKAEYDSYIRNGLMVQLRRIKLGKDVEEAHMRNRMWVSAWAYEKGKADSVIVKVVRDGETYYDIRDYDKLRTLFGELLREVQRIKSQGDYAAGKNLREGGPGPACRGAEACRTDPDRAVRRLHPAADGSGDRRRRQHHRCADQLSHRFPPADAVLRREAQLPPGRSLLTTVTLPAGATLNTPSSKFRGLSEESRRPRPPWWMGASCFQRARSQALGGDRARPFAV
jgi:hypothetical protein